ncbi:MAG: SurA N-terminal domain-containing protein [Deltaproteobacteria bacterium]|nr:SurA N-terminal domain-containing protein [Deltaproteobacteria bacterium]
MALPMLTRIRDSSKSIAFYVLGGIVVAVLIISFGTPPMSGNAALGGPTGPVLRVYGREVSAEEYRQTFLMARGDQIPVEQAKAFRLKEGILDQLIARQLLMREASRLGIAVGNSEIEDRIAKARMTMFGREQIAADFQLDGVFNYDRFKRYLQFFGMTERGFMDLQKSEVQASRVREILAGSAAVSEAEVKARFEREGNQVNLEYVRFSVRDQEEAIEPTTEEIAAWAAKNEALLKEQYEQRKFLFEKVPKERKLRHVVIRIAADATDAVKKTARAEAEKIARSLSAKMSFANVVAAARATRTGKNSAVAYEVEASRLGWRREGATSLPAEVEKKVLATADGSVTGPEETPDGFHVVVAEGTREGDLAFDAVKGELAEELVRKDLAKEKTKALAVKALADAQTAFNADNKNTLDVLYPKSPEAPAVAANGPQAAETGLFSRRGSVIEGIGISPELAREAFSLTAEKQFAGPYDVGGNFVIVRLKEHQTPDWADFEKTKADLIQGARELKGNQLVVEWVLSQCKAARNAKRLDFDKEILVYGDGKPGATAYEPCSTSPLGL